MRKSSIRRSSSANPGLRSSIYDREDKNSGRPEAKRSQIFRARVPSQGDNSQIPRSRIRSLSSERLSIRRSNLKITAKTPLSQPHHNTVSRLTTPGTPGVSSNRPNVESASRSRHRSPSAERASGFGSKGSGKDTRPINDKSYQSSMLSKIDQFFLNINQSSLLNPSGSLRPVTLKIFIEATSCLLKLLGVKHDISTTNYIEELPKISKKLLYPGTVAKSWLKTANTMHSWPQVLAWLSWLVEVCIAKDLATCAFQIEKLPFVLVNGKEEARGSTFLALVKMYTAWNEENPDEEAELLEQHVREVGNQYGDIESDISAALLNLQKEKQSFESMEQQSNVVDKELNEVKLILDKLNLEEAQETELLESTEARVKQIKLEMKELEMDNQTLKKRIQVDNEEHAKLNHLVKNQAMSVQERDAIVVECSEIQNCIHQFDNHVKDIENELYAMDIKFAASNQNLYKAILAYNKDIIMHLGCDTGADLEELQMPERNMLSSDFIEILRGKETAMLNVKEHMRKQLEQTESLIEANENELDSLKEKLRIMRSEKQNQMEKMAEHKIYIQELQRKANDTENKLKEQIKNVESDMTELHRLMPDLETALNELAEVKDKYEAVVRKKQFMEKSAERFFEKFYGILSNHRNKMSALLDKLSKR